jgi:phage tail sheath protein FI
VDGDGAEVLLTRPQANTLNAQGIVTLLNGFNGWRLWGNRTGVYPGNTDPKDAFIPIRRMFNWIGNTVILTTDANVDDPINRRLVDLVMGTLQSFINGLIAVGALLDGSRIEFREDENPTTDLSDGKIKWHLTLTPPSPAEELDFILEYDPSALEALFT